MTDLVAARSPYVDGRFVPGDAEAFGVVSPSTEEVAFEVEGSSVAQIDAAVAAARRAFDDGPWSRMSVAERAVVMEKLSDALHARAGVLLDTVVTEAGSARGFAEMLQVGFGLTSSREMIDVATRVPDWEHNELPFEQHVGGGQLKLSVRRWEPMGVVAAITPSNFPFTTNVWKLTPALMAGCTVVLRPSPQTPLEATVFGEAADEAGLPPGVINVVLEQGSDGAARLSTHPDVDVVSFTGSSAVGSAIAAQAAPLMKRLILELGGKSVQLYLPDAVAESPAKAVAGALSVFAAHAGQGCSLQTRVLVPQEQKAAVLEAIAAAAQNLPIGDPFDAKTVVGPVVSARSRERIEGSRRARRGSRRSHRGRWSPSRTPRPRLRLRAHARGCSRQCQSAGADRGVRPGGHRAGLSRPRRGDHDHQRLTLRPVSRHLHRRPRDRECARGTHPHRDRAGQRGHAQRLHAHGRLQAQRRRA
jgi:aldehyde dehydrogenase (NAD+)